MFRGQANKRISAEQGKDPLSKDIMKTLFTGISASSPIIKREIRGVDYVGEALSHPGFRMVVDLRMTNQITGSQFDQKVGTTRYPNEIEAQYEREVAGDPEVIARANAINAEAGRLLFPVEVAVSGVRNAMHLAERHGPAKTA